MFNLECGHLIIKNNIFRVQPTSGRKFLWTILIITILLILAAILFPTIIMLTRTDETRSTGTDLTI